MEYRGYEQVGVVNLNSGKLSIRKGIGKVEEVNKSLELKELGHLGIGHTRWGGCMANN